MSLLNQEPQIDIVGAFTDPKQALTLLDAEDVHVVITDLDMPTMSGEEVLVYCKAKFPRLKVILLSMHDESAIIKNLIALDADGYVLKSSGKEDIIASILLVHQGVKHFSEDVLKAVATNNQVASHLNPVVNELTNRELEVIKLIATGLSSKEIGAQLHVSHRTIETHRSNIMVKTGAKGLAGIIRFAFENRLVE